MPDGLTRAKLPGGIAVMTFLALGLGVTAWWVVDTMFPAFGNALRGTGTRSTRTSVSV